jgi:CheY-like chemotaxis protein
MLRGVSLMVEASPLRVLVVDDNVDAADALSKLLRMSGHDARTAYDGPSAVQIALEFVPRVVLLDIGLPGFDGYEVARRLRDESTLHDLVIIAVTGYGSEQDSKDCVSAGIDYHMVKPVEYDHVRKILEPATRHR